ncbi:VTT domain-containing protein [Candidatus Uhrbacteria bacterium]|nr:VTT domain-containing protein [Candidatus Uhrbacteria bacterium]
MLSWILKPFDLIFHLDRILPPLIATHGDWVYGLLSFIVFLETGLVIAPFLPGDSLLFAAGTMAAIGSLNPVLLWIFLWIAAVAGDALNYAVGRLAGERLLASRWLSRRHYDQAHAFYVRSGSLAIILARFIPIVRTFAPFVAGVSRMPYQAFFFYNIFGGGLWVTLFVWGGYFFGNLPFMRDRFSTVVIGIVIVSFLPFLWKTSREFKKR